jgi:hypothetical protein
MGLEPTTSCMAGEPAALDTDLRTARRAGAVVTRDVAAHESSPAILAMSLGSSGGA